MYMFLTFYINIYETTLMNTKHNTVIYVFQGTICKKLKICFNILKQKFVTFVPLHMHCPQALCFFGKYRKFEQNQHF